jgi:hypothetical protein
VVFVSFICHVHYQILHKQTKQEQNQAEDTTHMCMRTAVSTTTTTTTCSLVFHTFSIFLVLTWMERSLKSAMAPVASSPFLSLRAWSNTRVATPRAQFVSSGDRLCKVLVPKETRYAARLCHLRPFFKLNCKRQNSE